jgi:hypothetical protein
VCRPFCSLRSKVFCSLLSPRCILSESTALCSSNDAFLPFVFFLLVSFFEDLTVGDCPDCFFCGGFFGLFLCFIGGSGRGCLIPHSFVSYCSNNSLSFSDCKFELCKSN